MKDKIMNDRKAQTEIMGLVILVVLLVIGMLFYVKFALMTEKPSGDNSLELQRAVFIAGALAKVSICENISLQEAIGYCDNGENICGEKACDIIQKQVPIIVKSALGGEYEVAKPNVEGKKFSFFASKKDVVVSGSEVGKCPAKGIVGTYTFKSEITGKEYSANYKLC